jgi:hypothetical protein
MKINYGLYLLVLFNDIINQFLPKNSINYIEFSVYFVVVFWGYLIKKTFRSCTRQLSS